jgi:hypothetical protein
MMHPLGVLLLLVMEVGLQLPTSCCCLLPVLPGRDSIFRSH